MFLADFTVVSFDWNLLLGLFLIVIGVVFFFLRRTPSSTTQVRDGIISLLVAGVGVLFLFGLI